MTPSRSDHVARLERLSQRQEKMRLSAGYSRFVRAMRILLPLSAIGVVAILFIVTGMENEDAIVPVAKEETQKLPDRIVQNELLNPRFESRDRKGQPYEIVASRAIQGETNKDLIMLEKPVGEMTLKDGMKVKMTAVSGAYRQDTERFFLEGNVHLEHGEGYMLEAEEAHMDLKQNYAWTEKAVQGKGPDMQIEAQGLKANGKTGQILFTGPAKLTLEAGFKGLE